MKKILLALTLIAAVPAYAEQPKLIDELSRFIHTHASNSQKPNANNGVKGFNSPCMQFYPGHELPRVQNYGELAPRTLCYDAFTVLYSGVTKTPIFVAERLNRAELEDAKNEKRTNRFFADARLPAAERAQLEDYKGSGYDRGHMAPAADMPTAQAMAQSFSLANMVPQAPVNNRKSWAGIEKATRKFALRAKGDVYVFTGPVFDKTSGAIGPDKVRVPKYLYKLVYDESTGRAWAHWIENTDEARATKPISYQELVRRTGIEFLPSVSIQAR